MELGVGRDELQQVSVLYQQATGGKKKLTQAILLFSHEHTFFYQSCSEYQYFRQDFIFKED
jgi:hypothetical protein